MGRIVVSENVTLDGVVEDPTGEEGTAAGGWFLRARPEDRDAWAALMLDEARGAQALLLGRRSDAWFAERWASRTGPWADRLNALPKHVVSTTTREPRWAPGTVLGADVVEAAATLRREVAGDVVVYGSVRLVGTLLEHDLVDELRLVVFPTAAGTGTRLFRDASPGMSLCGNRTVGRDLVRLVYRTAERRP
ncbi:MAG: dihydrofolate reductase family protein [Actinomycetota bacterium]|nr:dihydrofolate reductase family protein [Actinomycetota bacterium]